MTQENQILLKQIGEIALLDFCGDLTTFSESMLNETYESASSQGTKKILLQFKKEAYINSAGISILIQILAKANKNNRLIGVTGLSDHFKKIFNMVGITKFASVYDNQDDALEAMQK